jgi:Uma2 family endonuclease
MSDVLSPGLAADVPEYHARLFTAADMAAMPTQLPSGPVRYELHRGRLITMAPAGGVHGFVEGNLGAALKVQGEFKGLGKAGVGDVGIVLARDPDHVYGADALFVSNARLPIRFSPEGYLETIPELVVEVRSKNETHASLQRKAADYLAAGGVVVWVVDPINRNVIEYRAGVAPRTYLESETLTAEDLIPGFALAVSLALQT